MSANINVTNPERPRRVALVAANAAISRQTGWPVGFWWAELTHPWWEFTQHGYRVDIFSVEGGALVADAFSDPEDPSGYSADDLISLGFKRSPAHASLIQNTRKIEEINIEAYDAIFLAGGQSPMYTFADNAKLHDLVVAFHESGRVVGVVCHATSVLLKARTSDGRLLVEGKTWTGFADSEEAYADGFVGKKIQPFWIETEARKISATNFITGPMFRPFAVRDGRLITGQQQYSGSAAARLIIEALGI